MRKLQTSWLRGLVGLQFLALAGVPIQIARAEVGVSQPPLFYIEPYWHPSGPTGERFTLSWEYFLEDDAPAVVREKLPLKLFRGSRLLRSISLQVAEGLVHAEFPDLCSMGSDLQVEIPFEGRRRSVPSEVCLRKLGLGPQETARFVFLADTQEFPDQTENTLRQLKKSDARLILNGGDLVQTGSDGFQWQAYFDSFREYLETHIVMPIVGNHEYRYDPNVSQWEKHFGGKAARWFYDFYLGDTQIIVLNSSFEDDPSLVSTQLYWLERVLARPSRFKIVTMHHAPFSVGLSHLDLAPRQEHRILQEKFVPLFERAKVDLVLSGHTHLFERSYKSGIQYLVTGAAGGKMGWMGAFNPYEIFSRAIRTLSEIAVDPDALEVKTWNDQGALEDRFVIPVRSR